MTACPKYDQVTAVSLTTSPVTQTADVAVNRESENETRVPSAEAAGSIKRRAPTRITPAKPKMMIWNVLSFLVNSLIRDIASSCLSMVIL
jgi:hypothetical protein